MPKVTVIEPKTPEARTADKDRRTQVKRLQAAHTESYSKYRPIAKDGMLGATPLEIAEGIAWKRTQDNPNDEEAETDRVTAFNALQMSVAHTGTVRCADCGVFRTGRSFDHVCGYCGGRWYLLGLENERREVRTL